MTQPPTPPAPPPLTPPAASAPAGSNRNLMIALSYLWILAIIPLIVEKEDSEVQWHAKNGLVLLVAEIICYAVIAVLSAIPMIGCAISILGIFVPIVFLIVRIVAIIKGINGERFVIPVLSDFVAKF